MTADEKLMTLATEHLARAIERLKMAESSQELGYAADDLKLAAKLIDQARKPKEMQQGKR